MKESSRKTAIKVVKNLLIQYINQLKNYRAWAETEFKSGIKYEDNVVKCDNGIAYAERILGNLDQVLNRNVVWQRKELVQKFHKRYSLDLLQATAPRTNDPKVLAENIEVVLESMGIRTWELFPSMLGYVLDRTQSNLLGLEDCAPIHHSGSFGKLSVNYGKTRDFDVFANTDHAIVEFDFRSIFTIVKKGVLNKARALSKYSDDQNDYLKHELNDFFNAFYYGHGTYSLSSSKFYKQQRNFAEFRRRMSSKENGLVLDINDIMENDRVI